MRLHRDTRGASAIEYVLALALVALVALGAWTALGTNVEERVECTADAIASGRAGAGCGAATTVPPGLRGARGPDSPPSAPAATAGGPSAASPAHGTPAWGDARSGSNAQPARSRASSGSDTSALVAAGAGGRAGGPETGRSGRALDSSPPGATTVASAALTASELTWAFNVFRTVARSMVPSFWFLTSPDTTVFGEPAAIIDSTGGTTPPVVTAPPSFDRVKAKAHRRARTRAERRRRLPWRIALRAMLIATPVAQRSYARAVRIVRFIRKTWRRAAHGHGTIRAAQRGVIRRASGHPFSRRLGRLLASTPMWHAYARVWRHFHRVHVRRERRTWTSPLRGSLIVTSPFGPRGSPCAGCSTFHQGTDFAGGTGTPIRAPNRGRVTFVGWCGGGGNCVTIAHPDGTTTKYMHMSAFAVHSGQTIREGQTLGRVGGTGNVTGPHLHLEVWRGGRPIDPVPFLRRHHVRI